MRIGSVIVAALICASCGGDFFRQYEYEEEMYLALDGSATVYVNSSVAALDALRGLTLDTKPATQVDRKAVAAYFTTPLTRVVGSVKQSRRNNRRFVHVRLEIDDVSQLGKAVPFSWSTYSFGREGDVFAYRQTVGASQNQPVTTNWTGQELVAFRMHLPSKVVFHNAGAANHKRGNILVWEQSLTDRLTGTPLLIETRVETESILYRTLWLFGLTAVAVMVLFVLLIWMIVRRGGKAEAR